jgi:hypothetical protein
VAYEMLLHVMGFSIYRKLNCVKSLRDIQGIPIRNQLSRDSARLAVTGRTPH